MISKKVTRYRVEIPDSELLTMIRAHVVEMPEGSRVVSAIWEPNFNDDALSHTLLVNLEVEEKGGLTEAELERGLAS